MQEKRSEYSGNAVEVKGRISVYIDNVYMEFYNDINTIPTDVNIMLLMRLAPAS